MRRQSGHAVAEQNLSCQGDLPQRRGCLCAVNTRTFAFYSPVHWRRKFQSRDARVVRYRSISRN